MFQVARFVLRASSVVPFTTVGESYVTVSFVLIIESDRSDAPAQSTVGWWENESGPDRDRTVRNAHCVKCDA